MEWQPIETAPKDGTVILILQDENLEDKGYDYYFSRKITLSRWFGDDFGSGYIDRYFWHDLLYERYGEHQECENPTHWMPLPEPPTS